MKISIIIPTYCPDSEVEGYLTKFLETFENNTPRHLFQLVVIEQGKPMFNQLATTHKPDIYVYKEKPIGYARAVNLGVAMSDGDYIVVMNNDLEVPEGWLERLVQDYENEFKGMGLLSVMDTPRPGITYNESWYSLFIIGRKTWQTIGYFDEILNYRFHDQDYSIKLVKAGFQLGRTGNVLVKHIDGATFKKMGIDEGFEKHIMTERHGATMFNEWFQKK